MRMPRRPSNDFLIYRNRIFFSRIMGPQAGGMFFDYAMTSDSRRNAGMMPRPGSRDVSVQRRKRKKLGSVIDNTNPRESLARFQLGLCRSANRESRGGTPSLRSLSRNQNHRPRRLAQVRNSFKLRYGTSQIKLGKTAEGIATIQELFDNREAWKVKPPFLMQGILELGMGWIDEASPRANGDPKKTGGNRASSSRLSRPEPAVCHRGTF